MKSQKKILEEKNKNLLSEKIFEKENLEKIILNLKKEKNYLEKKINKFEMEIEENNLSKNELENLRESLFNSTTYIRESNLMEIYEDLENVNFENSFKKINIVNSEKNNVVKNLEDFKEEIEILKDRLENSEYEKNGIEQRKNFLEKKIFENEKKLSELKKEKNDLFLEIKNFVKEKLEIERELEIIKKENKNNYVKISDFLELEKKVKFLEKTIKEKEEIINSLEQKLVKEMKRLTRLTQSSTDISKFEFETVLMKKETLEKKLKEKKNEIENLKKEKDFIGKNEKKEINKIVNKLENENNKIKKLNKKIQNEILSEKNIIKPEQTDNVLKTDKIIRNRIKTILKKPQNLENSQITKTKKQEKYSYDYLNINSRKTIINIIKQFQSLTNIKNCFSEIIYRLNTWSNKKKKWLVVTTRYLYIFNSPSNLKKAIRLKEIVKMKHNKKNNFIGICTQNLEEEIIEIYKKEELILFINRKLKRLGKSLEIQERKSFNKLQSSDLVNISEPSLMKKHKPFYLETFSKASKEKNIGYITICKKELFGMLDKEIEFLALLTNYGILFFTEKFELVDFVPLIGARLELPEDKGACFFKVFLTDRTERFFRFHSICQRDFWVGKVRGVIMMN